MLRHIVMWSFHDQAEGADKAANVEKARQALWGFKALVPGIRGFEVGTAQPGLDCTADLVLNMLLDDAQTLSTYQQHPEHAAIKPFMKAVVRQRQCMDFEV